MKNQRYSNSDSSNDSRAEMNGRRLGPSSSYRSSQGQNPSHGNSDRYQGRESEFRNDSRHERIPSSRSQASSQGVQDWYSQDPMDEYSGYRSEDHSTSHRMQHDPSRSHNDREFDRYATRSPSSWGSGQSYNYSATPDYGNTSHSADNYSGRSGADRSGASRYNQQNEYGSNSYGYGSQDQNRSFDRNYDYRGNQNSSFRPQSGRNDESSRGSFSSSGSPYGQMDRGSDMPRNRSGRDGGNSYDYDRFQNSSQHEPYADQWQAYGTMDRNSPSSEGGRDRNRFQGRGPKSFKRSDERIQDEICEMLTRHGEIDADDVDVQVKEGEVTLSGSVTERRMKHMVEDCVEKCFGVRDVTNNIKVRRSNEPSYGSQSESQTMRQSSSSDSTESTSAAKNAGGKKSSSSSATTGTDDTKSNH